MNQLQKALLTNALFSGLSGVILVHLNKHVVNLFDVSNTPVFVIIGVALIFFSLTIIYQIKRQSALGVLSIIVLDVLWVVGSTILLIFQPFEISETGNCIIAVLALFVSFMGINQANALAQIDNKSKKGLKQLRFERAINATKEKVWKVISDVANYHQVAPNIDDLKILSGNGKGMVRICSHGKDSWTETCSLWIEEKEYAFEVDASAPNYPYPFKYLKGNWKVEEIDRARTRVVMAFEFEYKKNFQNWLLHPILKGKFSKTAEKLLDNWQKKVEKL